MEIYAKIAFIYSGIIDDKRACNLTYMVVYTNFSPTVNKVCKLNDQQHTCSVYYLLYFISFHLLYFICLCIHNLPHKNKYLAA